MALYLSPLVDVIETDLSTTIPSVATSIAVAVLRDTYKGAEAKQTLITSVDELIDAFGEPTDNSYRDVLAATGYLKYGNKLWCTRVMAPSASFAGVYGTASGATTLTAYAASAAYILGDLATEDPDQLGDETVTFDAGRPEYGSDIMFLAKSRGTNGNFTKVAIIGKTKYDYISANYTTTAAVTAGSGLSSDLVDDVFAAETPFDASDGSTEFLVLVRAADQEDISRSVVPYTLKEVFLVSTDPRKTDDEGKNIFCENVINAESQYIRMAVASTLHNDDVSGVYTTDYTTLAGGVRNNSDSILDADIITAYELYQDPEEIDINIFIDSGKSDTVKDALITICEARKDATAILDVPEASVVNNKGSETADVRTYRRTTLNPNTSYAQLYANWLNVYDKWNAKYRWIPISGHIAGIFANTDDVTDPWFAPAGLNRAILTSVRKLAYNPTRGNRDILYKNGINPVVSFAGQGKVVWGQKNLLDKSSAFNRINVRRLFIVLEKAISTAAKYFLFEPNDEFTRLQLINMIDPFLRDVKARRGVYDFLIVCDERNNTAERIDRNELWCDIYIKPTRAAEYIVLNFIATKTGASFTELVAATTPT